MWFPRKLGSVLKQKISSANLVTSPSTQSINIFQKKIQASYVMAVIGTKSTGKSAFINCLQLVEVKQRGTSGRLFRLKYNEKSYIRIHEYDTLPNTIDSIDGAIICYDVTNRDSMDHLPDTINAFISHSIPCLLIGLKVDLTISRTVDPTLGHLIGNLFNVEAIESDTRSLSGVQLLQKCFFQFIDLETKTSSRLSIHHEQNYETDPKEYIMDLVNPINNNSTNSNIHVIIDKLIYNSQDEDLTTIFLTVYRKFMKPGDLVNILIKKFEADLNKDILPTHCQERIRSFFCLWLSHYWGDFHSSVVRRLMLEFLERMSCYPSLHAIRDMLVPLAIREPATVDKDDHWGLCDDPESSEDRLSSKQRKKDSGYCETFGNWLKQSEQEKVSTFSHIQRTISAHSHYKLPLSLRQLASLHSSNTISSQFMDSNNSYRRNSSPVSLRLLQQQQQQQQYHQQQLRHSYDCNSNTNSSSSNRAKFVGGEILAIMEEAELKYGNRGFLFNDFYVISVTPAQELASQFTFIEAELFRKIQPRDFLRHLYSNKTKTALFALVEHFNFVSAWIASFIVRQNELSKRIIVFEYCLKIATELRHLNNFNGLMAVLAGINSAAVLRLKQTRQAVKSNNPDLYHQFLKLELLMSSERSFNNYRTALKQVQSTGIPYLGIHQQDLVSLSEANKDHTMDGQVHWKKFYLMGETILEMIRFKYPTYHMLTPDPFLLWFIANEPVLTEDERYEKSKVIEPRTLTSTSSRWLTAL